MINIAQVVDDTLRHDDIALAAAHKGWLNLSSYARAIQPEVQATLLKDVQEGSIVTALSRITASLPPQPKRQIDVIQSLAVHTNIEGITYERTTYVSALIRETYNQINADNNTFLTITQGINEVTILAETQFARLFREKLNESTIIYDKRNLVGITVKFAVGNLDVPNLIFALTRRLAYKSVNIIEVVSTATEMTYVIEKKDLATALEQLQKDI
jgi:aspartokinase